MYLPDLDEVQFWVGASSRARLYSGFLLCNLVTYKQLIFCDMSCDEFEAKGKKTTVMNETNPSMDLAHIQKRRVCLNLGF